MCQLLSLDLILRLNLIVYFYGSIHGVESLRLTKIHVPNYGIFSRGSLLECEYELGDDSFYALKWYKDGHEFFRFKPKDEPQITAFPVLGTFVNVNKSTGTKVSLDNISLESEGDYRCEISADAPSFQTVYKEKNMKIISLPVKGPKISGVYPWYNLGDNLTAVCSFTKTFPEPKLTWFINGDKVNENEAISESHKEIEDLKSKTDKHLVSNDSSELRTISNQVYLSGSSKLRMSLNLSYFHDGSIVIKCQLIFPTIVLNDTVTVSVKSGLMGLLQYADSLSSSSKFSSFSILIIGALGIIINFKIFRLIIS